MKTGLAALAIILIVAAGYGENSVATGKTFYVSVSGSDSADGLTEKTAWRTITCAAKVAAAGDTVKIRAGNYGGEHVVVANSGTKDKPIVFEGYDGLPELAGKGKAKGHRSLGTGISIVRRSYITLKNIKVSGYYRGIRIAGEGNNVVTGCMVSLCARGMEIGSGNVIDNCTLYYNHFSLYLAPKPDNCLVTNTEIYLGKWNNFWVTMSGHHNTLRSNASYTSLNHSGIDLHTLVHHNFVENCLVQNTPDNGIFLHNQNSHDNYILDCVSNFHYKSITLFQVKDNIVERCFASGGRRHQIQLYSSSGNAFRQCVASSVDIINHPKYGATEKNVFSNDAVGKYNLINWGGPCVGTVIEDPPTGALVVSLQKENGPVKVRAGGGKSISKDDGAWVRELETKGAGISVKVERPGRPGTPGNSLVLASSALEAYVRWDDPSNGQAGFILERKAGRNGRYRVIATLKPKVSLYRDKGLLRRAVYYYRVKSVGGKEYSREAMRRSPGRKAISFYAKCTSVKITDRTDRAVEFEVRKIKNLGGGPVWRIEHRNVTDGVRYVLRDAAGSVIKAETARDGAASFRGLSLGDGTYRIAEAGDSTRLRPNRPSLLVAFSAGTDAHLAWHDNSNNETAYVVERANAEGGRYEQIGRVAPDSEYFIDKDAAAGVKFLYRVYAANEAGKSAYSNEAGRFMLRAIVSPKFFSTLERHFKLANMYYSTAKPSGNNSDRPGPASSPGIRGAGNMP